MGESAQGNPPPTAEQQALATSQATTTANLNLEENEQRKTILSALNGTRNFRGSALSRSVAGNNDAPGPTAAAPGPSQSQINAYGQITSKPTTSLLDTVNRGGVANGTGGGSTGANNIGRGQGGK